MTSDPRALLRRHGLAPKKSFGQNFLVNGGVLRQIAEACVPEGERGRAEVVEIGAGTGALTAALLERAAHVTAIERDRELVPLLEAELAPQLAEGRLRLVEASATHSDLEALLSALAAPRVLCGNLPYQLTGQLIEQSVGLASLLVRAVFMVQEEVADRLAAGPGTKTYGALSVFTQARFAVRRVARVSPGSFFPPPQVTSAVVSLTPHAAPRAVEDDGFRSVVKLAFAMRRKTLRNAWAPLGEPRVIRASERAGISLAARGETLTVEEFARMAEALAAE
ncbi:MAG: ribosomal RNA small subunit methyltransferase A [Myxococcales bacterium]|nr:ribosomal RNA small subunit methyltransferase A [Myxococcales bacterium]MBL0195121.1 ribosomal RNA small subunit methyltransferase A [Myxococcales bacterium]HQY62862.1 16S rRNA (adenine(1518)-N(6)/adenine(1519)-N(6))-dimethyltransferase RsmA [Polyangiaceae bacterium]